MTFNCNVCWIQRVFIITAIHGNNVTLDLVGYPKKHNVLNKDQIVKLYEDKEKVSTRKHINSEKALERNKRTIEKASKKRGKLTNKGVKEKSLERIRKCELDSVKHQEESSRMFLYMKQMATFGFFGSFGSFGSFIDSPTAFPTLPQPVPTNSLHEEESYTEEKKEAKELLFKKYKLNEIFLDQIHHHPLKYFGFLIFFSLIGFFDVPTDYQLSDTLLEECILKKDEISELNKVFNFPSNFQVNVAPFGTPEGITVSSTIKNNDTDFLLSKSESKRA
ncbi:hypothetical protein ACTFIR_011925 [Dictyostelium discoideum]